MSESNHLETFGVNWQQFGLRRSPYDTAPLLDGEDISIEQLFIGRESERAVLDRFFASEERGCVAICGDVGVGKTSLANFEKFIWRNNRPRLLLSSRSEIEANGTNLSKQQFLLNIISLILREIELVDPDLVQKNVELQKIKSLVDAATTIQRSWGIQAGVPQGSLGFNYGKDQGFTQPVQLTDAALEGYLNDLITVVKANEIAGQKFGGIIVHMNNFDVVMGEESGNQKAINFFNEIRDLLQHESIFFIFLGPSDFFSSVISKNQRVKAVFAQTPIMLDPLSKTELLEAMQARMEAFRINGVKKIIKPVEDEVLTRFYDLYGGDVRSVLSAISDVVRNATNQLSGTIGVDDALALLARDRKESISNILTPEVEKTLQYMLDNPSPLRQTDIAKALGKQQSNTAKYLKQLKERGVIEIDHEKNGGKYLKITNDFACLRHLASSEKRVKDRAQRAESQLKLAL